MLDPLSHRLATAEIEDEPLDEEDRRAIDEAVKWSKHNRPIPMGEVLGDLGLTVADWEAMARTPLDQPLPIKGDG
ncbi:MAG: hypothetical protein IT162_08030 [Bryobacterales bacterium]|nr:hypothetical protein [Bryobacterales bacterium]